MKQEYLSVVEKIGEKHFRKNVFKWNSEVYWSSMSLEQIIDELIAFDVDPATFEY